MNDRLKFRAWDKDRNLITGKPTMHYYDPVTVCDMSLDFFCNTHIECEEDELIIMQSTGRRDKNGKLMHEGDIVKMHRFLFDGSEYESEVTGVVVYNAETMSYHLNKISNADIKKYMGYEETEAMESVPICMFCGLHEESWEVIGNIYEQEGVPNG